MNRIGNVRLTCLRLLETFVQCYWPGVPPPPRAGLVNSVGTVGPVSTRGEDTGTDVVPI